MKRLQLFLKYAVTSGFLALAGGSGAQDAVRLDALFEELAQASAARAQTLEAEIVLEWERSGSDAMDYLYERGKAALERGDAGRAVEHFTAVLDHGPSFWQAHEARAAAYMATGHLGAALADLGHVLRHEPRHFYALARIAAILEQTEKSSQALEALEEIKAVHPHMVDLDPWIARLTLALEGAAL